MCQLTDDAYVTELDNDAENRELLDHGYGIRHVKLWFAGDPEREKWMIVWDDPEYLQRFVCLDVHLQAAVKRLSGMLSPHFANDLEKARKADKFIGQGSPGSSTQAYARALWEYANTGRYNANDTVFVSVERTRRRCFDPIAPYGPRGVYMMIDSAIAAGARFVIDSPADRSGSYNRAEQQVAAYLVVHGYVETEPGLFAPAGGVRTQAEASA